MNGSDSASQELNNNSEEWKSWPPEFFLTVLVPELWTPLMAIKGYAEILADESMKEHHPQALEIISKNLEKIAKLCDGIAEYRNELMSRNNI
jgi:signal transduction histidine kinase